jgi:hypothetical protein
MAISRFQMNRQLRAYGGIMGQDGRRNYGIGSFFQEKIMDPLKKVVKSPAALAAAGLAVDQFGIPIGGGKKIGGGKNVSGFLGNIFRGITGGGNQGVTADAEPVFSKVTKKEEGDGILKTIGKTLTTNIPGTEKSLAGLLMTPQALALGSGLLAGAFTKDKEDPIYTGQDVGLNLQDIAKLANISDPKTAAAIGLRFSPDVESRKFSPEEMAATYAANQERDFTEQREQAQDGGIMGDQKDFEQFLQDMKDRDMGAMQDQILRDFQKYMERKKMIEQMPEAKDGGIMKMAEGGMMDMGGMEMDLRGGGFVPMGRAEKADDVPARLSKNEFVFTADAVRAAGGGNVDKGADKMYATMKKLEDRVA